MTDSWLSDVLHEHGVLTDARVTEHTTTLLGQQGLTAVVARLELTYSSDEANAPRSLIGKFASPEEPMRLLQHQSGGYVREIEFYRQFGANAGIPTPHCYHASIDSDSGVFAMLLEDLAGSREFDMETAVEDVEVAVRYLASFHAMWWNHPRLRALDFLHYPGTSARELFVRQGLEGYAGALSVAKERLGSLFPGRLVAPTERLVTESERVVEAVQRDDGHSTLVHGDYHPLQLFFENETGGRFAVFADSPCSTKTRSTSIFSRRQ